PTGQSGNIFSPYYADQSKLYRDGNFRKQMMSRKEIEEKAQSKLTLVPLP
ncbi:MAG: penicillin acylase family protein, partial [Bacteroidetes bacterium]|nr:penicillin acylase family protein [Bacteroidota bacterium]